MTAATLRMIHRHRPRLLGSTLFGIVTFFLIPGDLALPIRIILAWDLGVVAFLVLILSMMLRTTPEQLRLRAQLDDENAWVILLVMVGAALASLLAIGFVLHGVKDQQGLAATASVVLVGATIFLSWAMTHTLFAMHFAHAFYGDSPGLAAGRGGAQGPSTSKGDKISGGLAFPGDTPPDYADFLYFSFVVGMTCQVSDVQVTSSTMRRLTLVHGLVAFLFNTVILALCINLVAGLL